MKNQEILEDLPVVKFWYQGDHSHPVRRTGLLRRITRNRLEVYEIREGSVVRKLSKAKLKFFRRDKIARFGDYCRLRNKSDNPRRSTLQRMDLVDLLKVGV